MKPSIQTDTLIIGAGAAGLMCASLSARNGASVTLIDHSRNIGEKIRISGGGRCNFTNIHAAPKNYISQNPNFCISALKRYTPQDFVNLVQKHGISYHEKTLGQLFCDQSSKQIIDMLVSECLQYGVKIIPSTKVIDVLKPLEDFIIATENSIYHAKSLVIASGGLSIPKMGASGFGYEIARKFGHNIIETRAGLVPFLLGEKELDVFKPLSGIALEVVADYKKASFREAMLFTHRGLSGPAVLQISSYVRPGDSFRINLCPDFDVYTELLARKQTNPKQEIGSFVNEFLPKRLASVMTNDILSVEGKIGALSKDTCRKVANLLNYWKITPSGTEGYRTAEVTLGGVDTREISSLSFESKKVPGLYFIGEVLDVTGQLGGYNFQWAWASGHASGSHLGDLVHR